MWGTLDTRDLIYTLVGLALFGLTFQPALARWRIFNLPLFYLLLGACFGTLFMRAVDPLGGEISSPA